MNNIDKIVEAVNLPKKVIDGAESFLRTLLGTATVELGGIIGDEIKYRRFKNQVKIFTRAEALLKSKSINPKQINLKTIVPLIEYSSLEEEETSQIIWANVIANISSYETEGSLNLKCIEVLKQITSNEIILLDKLYNIFEKEKQETIDKYKTFKWFKNLDNITPENSVFSPWEFLNQLNFTSNQMDLYIDRLISFGILKYEKPFLQEDGYDENIRDIFSGTTQRIGIKTYELEASERVHFTNFGLYFVKICKYESL